MRRHAPAEWLPLCRELIDSFFSGDADSAALLLVETQWQEIIEQGMQAAYQQPIPVTLLRDERARLDQQRISQRSAGPINFCTLMPMRSIPFKVVCLLGMNDGVYPRTGAARF